MDSHGAIFRSSDQVPQNSPIEPENFALLQLANARYKSVDTKHSAMT
jgi:hypothetical protein